jgi:hypothetical protein
MTTTYGTSIKDVEKLMEQKITYALKQTQNVAYKVIQDFIKQYYNERVFYSDNGMLSNMPNQYERTFSFFNSLVKSEIKYQGNNYWCEIYIDQSQLDYYAHDGLTVLNMINDGFHSNPELNNDNYHAPYIESQIHFWDDSIDVLQKANYIMNQLVYYLKRAGLTVV